jgi:hypothetical protein
VSIGTTAVAEGRLAADDPRHGTTAGAVAGCGCLHCRVAIGNYKTTRERRIAYGTWQPYVDAEPVREHLRILGAAGIGWQQAATVADVSPNTVNHLLYGKGGRLPARRCRKELADVLFAVQPILDNYADHALVDATGTVRRLRALVVAGWPMQDLGDRLPGHRESMRRLIRNGAERVTAEVARAARDLYDALPEPIEDRWTPRRRALAASLGWAGAGAWDVDTIDDPAAVPNLGDPDADLVDEIAVHRVLNGEPLTLTAAERHHAIAVGLARGMSPNAISAALRMSGARVRELAAQLQAA